MSKTKTVCVSANLRGTADDPLAANAPNPEYLAALAGALDLAEESRVLDLARALANPERSDFVSALLCHELASCHRLAMRFGAMADQFLSHTSATVDADRRQVGRDAQGFAAIAARLMARYQQGALALPKIREAANGGVRKIIVDWGRDVDSPTGGSGGNGSGNSNDPNPAGPASGPAGPAGAAAAAPLRRGRLKNGNPSGDYLAAPRCGAKTRAGCACRQPAMKSGRCRLHGGRSTGARTAAGRHRARTARLVHGRRTAAVIGLRSAAAAVNRRLAWMSELAREISAGHGVHRSDSIPPLEENTNRRDAETPRCHDGGAGEPRSATSNSKRERTSRHQSSPAGVARANTPDSASLRQHPRTQCTTIDSVPSAPPHEQIPHRQM